jgi:AcrR family transcriptional regulator
MSRSHLRADAQANRDRLLEVATTTLARDGDSASLRAIAKEAGVGIGTLYRRFPTRAALVEAVYRTETERLCAAAPELLEQLEPVVALRAWMDRFVDHLAAKRGIAGTLQTVLTADGEKVKTATRELVSEAIAELVAAGVEAGTIRPDTDPTDIMFAAGGAAVITEGEPDQHVLAGRLLDLIVRGVATEPAPAVSTRRGRRANA